MQMVWIIFTTMLAVNIGMLRSMLFNKCLNRRASTVLTRVSYAECLDQCRLRPYCLSVHYKRLFKVCEINDAKAVGGINECLRSVYKEKADTDDTRVCENNVCPFGSKCTESGCKIAECEPLPTRPNRTVWGNRNSVGNKLKFTCDQGFHLSDREFSECLDDGTWSYDTKCVRSSCTPTLIIPNGYISSIDIKEQTGTQDGRTLLPEDSILYFQCSGCFELKGVNSSVCKRGEWNVGPNCIERKTTIFSACSSNSECLDPGSQCLNKNCGCSSTLSYSYSQCGCVDRCTGTLASTFQKTPYTKIKEHNEARHDGSLSSCKTACLNARGFVCRSFDFVRARNRCYLHSFIIADKTNWMRISSRIDYYQRDCA